MVPAVGELFTNALRAAPLHLKVFVRFFSSMGDQLERRRGKSYQNLVIGACLYVE